MPVQGCRAHPGVAGDLLQGGAGSVGRKGLLGGGEDAFVVAPGVRPQGPSRRLLRSTGS